MGCARERRGGSRRAWGSAGPDGRTGMTRAGGGSYRLVMLRHGQSEWNARNLFTGWMNVPLTEAGEREAVQAGRLLAAHRLRPGLVHTSVQSRAAPPTSPWPNVTGTGS